MTVAIIQFPGSNCEYETKKALDFYGLSSQIVTWNCSESELSQFDAYIIPGGFSYQDRVRAGALPAKLPVMGVLTTAALQGKPILGICNGCQILVESGLVPDLNQQQHIQVALAPNQSQGKDMGFICDWVYLKARYPKRNLFTRYIDSEEVLPIAINHGEGRFVYSEETALRLSELAQFQYVNELGEGVASYPVNPNGSMGNIAGLSNVSGNVFAMMPHPERAYKLDQVPFSVGSTWSMQKEDTFSEKESKAGPWESLFVSLAEHLTGRSSFQLQEAHL